MVGKIVGRGFNVLSQIILARILGPTDYGLYVLGLTVLKLLSLVAPLGLNRGVIQFGSRYWQEDDTRFKGAILQSLGLAFLFGTFVAVIVFWGTPQFAHYYQKPDLVFVLHLFALTLPFFSGLKVAAASTRISQRMKFAVFSEDLSQPVFYLISIVVVYYFFNNKLKWIIGAYALSFLVAFVLAIIYLIELFPEITSIGAKTHNYVKKLLVFSLPTSVSSIFVMFLMWADRLWIGYYWPESDVGIYQTAAQISTLFLVIMGSFGAILSPMIAKIYNKSEVERLNEIFKVSTRWGIYVGMPLFLAICFASKEMITVIFGAEYSSGYLILIILAVGQMINLSVGVVGPILMMTENQNRWLMISISMFSINLVMNRLLVPWLGISGAAISTMISVGGLYILGLFQVRMRLNLWPYDQKYYKLLFASLITVVVLFCVRLISFDGPKGNLFLTLFTSISVFNLVMIKLGFEEEDRLIIHFRGDY